MKNNKYSDLLFRYTLFIIGLFIASLGVAFSTKAGLGTSPVSSIPYSISLVNNLLSFGGWLNVLSICQITVQVILLKKQCNAVEIAIQTILAFVYGYLTNFSCMLIRKITPASYAECFFYMILSCFILAFGIWLQFMGGVAMLPGEAMNRAIAQVTGKGYENVKITFDVLYIILSVIICLIFLGKLEGVREGSIIAAFLVGYIIKGYKKVFNLLCKR